MINLPYEKYYADKEEPETFKLLSELVIHNMGWGYTCFVSAFMIFVSEKEIKCQKSQVIQFFSTINSLEAFEALKLPIMNVTDCSDGTQNKGFEINLEKKSQLKKIIGVNKLDCYPVLWVLSNPSKTEWKVNFK